MWWSANLLGGVVEPEPDIVVGWHRLDADTTPIVSTPSDGIGYTPEDGWFMLQEIGSEPSGCWRVTVTSWDATLNYVTEMS